jgi:hypothetical protein
VALASLLILAVAGCQKATRTSDPALVPIQEMLDTQLPAGTPRANVYLYLSTQGYPTEQTEKRDTIVAIIRKIDTQRLEPVTARVTFYFDANGKLTGFELERTMNQPIS